MEDRAALVQALAQIACEAGREIMEVYERAGDIAVISKGDESPLTEADTRANTTISHALAKLTPHIPVISEEAALLPFEQRRSWQEYWLVDPLDGTKEFISRNGEFTVNIALVRKGVPVIGVVHAPVTGHRWLGVAGLGAWKQTSDGPLERLRTRLLPADIGQTEFRVVASRRHGGDTLRAALAHLEPQVGHLSLLSLGSSLKFCAIAEGKADFYARFAPTCEWDTAAAQVILEAAGGGVVDTALTPLVYNTKDSILNPSFLALGDLRQDWAGLLGLPVGKQAN